MLVISSSKIPCRPFRQTAASLLRSQILSISRNASLNTASTLSDRRETGIPNQEKMRQNLYSQTASWIPKPYICRQSNVESRAGCTQIKNFAVNNYPIFDTDVLTRTIAQKLLKKPKSSVLLIALHFSCFFFSSHKLTTHPVNNWLISHSHLVIFNNCKTIEFIFNNIRCPHSFCLRLTTIYLCSCNHRLILNSLLWQDY